MLFTTARKPEGSFIFTGRINGTTALWRLTVIPLSLCAITPLILSEIYLPAPGLDFPPAAYHRIPDNINGIIPVNSWTDMTGDRI
jgi:hypothetical protein